MRYFVVFAVIILLSIPSSEGFRKPRKHVNPISLERSRSSSASYQTEYFTQNLDHFNLQNSQTYQQRYLINDQYLGQKNLSDVCAGPILFYTGNEGDITEFYDNSGFITEVLAPEFGGLIVFAEHRYYGESKPFGADSFVVPNIGFLSTEQALADFATLIRFLKNNSTYSDRINKCPVIAFGGSYGGMLTAWMRMKYPNVIAGGLASSAPVAWFLGAGIPDLEYVYAKIVTQDYAAVSSECSSRISTAFNQMVSMGQTSSGQQQLKNIFHLCNTPNTDALMESFLSLVEEAYDTMAQYDYPYPSTFAGNLPGWPVNVACQKIMAVDGTNTTTLLEGIYQGMNIYYNYTGDGPSCYNVIVNPDPYGGSWGYQTCTEMVMPYGSNGQTDMFWNDPWVYSDFEAACQKRWKVTPRPNWAVVQWGGLDVSAASNIFFSNGVIDPYSGGGILSTIKPSLPAWFIQNSAHHLDLRGPNSADPVSIRQARELEKSYIESWIYEYINMQQ